MTRRCSTRPLSHDGLECGHGVSRCPRSCSWRSSVRTSSAASAVPSPGVLHSRRPGEKAAYRDWDYWGVRSQASVILTRRSSWSAWLRRRMGKSHRPRLHRRPLGRLPLRGAFSRRAGEPADLEVRDDGLKLSGAWVTAAAAVRSTRQQAACRKSSTTASGTSCGSWSS